CSVRLAGQVDWNLKFRGPAGCYALATPATSAVAARPATSVLSIGLRIGLLLVEETACGRRGEQGCWNRPRSLSTHRPLGGSPGPTRGSPEPSRRDGARGPGEARGRGPVPPG